MDNIIISGTSSGLGSYLKERMDCFIFERQKPDIYPKNKNNIIIHTAFDSSKNILCEVEKTDNVYPMVPAGSALEDMLVEAPKFKVEKPTGST